MDTHKSNTQDKSSEEALHDHIIAAMCDGCRLHLVFDQILDTDLQPNANDFSIIHMEERRTVRAASLKAAIRKGKSWSLISLLLDQPLQPGAEIQINYHPLQWFLWSVDTEEPIEPFDFNIVVSDSRAVHGINIETDSLNLEAVPHSLAEVDAEPKIDFAFDRRIKITFGRELDLNQQPKARDFRAEHEASWLDISSVHLARAGKSRSGKGPWPELWIMLRAPLQAGTRIEIGYKAPDNGLHTKAGEIVKSFRISGVAAKKEPEVIIEAEPVEQNDQQGIESASLSISHESVEEQKQDNIVSLFDQDETAENTENENPYASQDFEQNEQEGEEETEVETKEEPPVLSDLEDFELAPEEQEDLPKLPRQVVRTYLSDGSSVTLGEEELAAEAEANTSEPIEIPQEKINYRQSLKEASLPVKVAVGAGFFVVFWLCTALLTFVIKLFGVSLYSPEMDSSVVTTQSKPADVRKPCEMTYHDGSQYKGMCLGNKRDGGGSYQWASGDVYKGDWVKDKQHGNGMLKYKNGDVYTGTFENNKKHGMGSMKWASGSRYQGGYNKGKFHGRGTYWSANGNRFEGVFKNGHTTNEGTCYFPDNTSKPGACP